MLSRGTGHLSDNPSPKLVEVLAQLRAVPESPASRYRPLWLDFEVSFHRNEIELAGNLTIRPRPDGVEKHRAHEIRSGGLLTASALPIVADLKQALESLDRLPVAVGHDTADRRLISDDADTIDLDHAIDVPAYCLVVERRSARGAGRID